MSDSNLLVLAREFKKLREDTKKVLALPVGPQGEQGVKGDKGDPGQPGKDGRNGTDGRDGLPGHSGKNGINGVDGKDGSNGVGIASVEVTFDNSLLVRLTDGSEIDAGEINVDNALRGPSQVLIQQGSSGAGGGLTLSQVSADFGTVPVYSQQFVFSDASVTTTSKLIMTHHPVSDEAEMDGFICSAHCSVDGTVTAYVHAIPGPVTGSRLFNYSIG